MNTPKTKTNSNSSGIGKILATSLLAVALNTGLPQTTNAQNTPTTKTQTNKQFGAGLETTTMNKDEMETFMSKEGIYNTSSKNDISKFRPTLSEYQLKVVCDIFDRGQNTWSRYVVFCYYIRREVDKNNPKQYKRIEKKVNELTPEDKKRCNEQVDASMRLALLYSLKQ